MTNRTFCLSVALLMALSLNAFADIQIISDKTCYIAGEQILCSAFCDEANSIAYLQLREEGSTLAATRLLLENGRGGGSLTIPAGIPTGTYTLLCHTASGASDSFILIIFNTSSAAKREGVRVGSASEEPYLCLGSDKEPVRSPGMEQGLEISAEGSRISIRNSSTQHISCCLSVTRNDGLPRCNLPHKSAKATSSTSAESDGEIIRAHLVGPDAATIATEENVTAVISFPGVKTGIYTAKISPDGSVTTQIEPVFGKRDIACLLYGESQGKECHLELLPKNGGGPLDKGPDLVIFRQWEKALLWRTNALIRSKAGAGGASSVRASLPVRREHFFLDGEATTFILDDYKRFPTMEEEFVEILKCVRRHRSETKADRTKEIQVLVDDAKIHDVNPSWGDALVMMDGVPVFDQSKIWKYDPALVREIEIYRQSYTLGYRVYAGVINFITFKGNVPAMSFNDNVRLYDFDGCSYPMEVRGESTLYWHPLLELSPGEEYSVECPALVDGAALVVGAPEVVSAPEVVEPSKGVGAPEGGILIEVFGVSEDKTIVSARKTQSNF